MARRPSTPPRAGTRNPCRTCGPNSGAPWTPPCPHSSVRRPHQTISRKSKSRFGKLNQQLVDLKNTIQSVDAKISGGGGPASIFRASRIEGGSASTGFLPRPLIAAAAPVNPGATNPAVSLARHRLAHLRPVLSLRWRLWRHHQPAGGSGSAPAGSGIISATIGGTDLTATPSSPLISPGENRLLAKKLRPPPSPNTTKSRQTYAWVLRVHPRASKSPRQYRTRPKPPASANSTKIVKRYPGTEEDRRAPRRQAKRNERSLSPPSQSKLSLVHGEFPTFQLFCPAP